MNKSIKIILVVLILTIIGGFLRFFNNTRNPNSLNIDEVAYGYSAYSILKTGHDENGIFLPMTFRSVGDFKNPILIYTLVPSIAIFGLNEFSVRFTTALLGTLTIPAFFLLVQSLVKIRKIALLAAAALAISPWHIYYSRFASESLIGLFFLILGIYFFQKIQQGLVWIFLSSLNLMLAAYSYHSLRLFIPIFIFSLILVELKKKRVKKKNLFYFVVICLILGLPLLYITLFGSANTRAGMVFLSQDIDYTRYVIIDHIKRSGELFLLFFFWLKRYLNYFQPDFLFFQGLNMTTPGTLGLGVLYLYELPWFILGLLEFIKKKIENKAVIILWILIGIFPASLTNNEQSSVRSLIILPMLLLIISYGAIYFLKLINGLENKYFKLGMICGYLLFIVIVLVQSFLVFSVHFPLERGEAFMEGTKETVLYALKNRDKYREIVYDPYRGIEAPYIVNIPHMYLLFYSQYDPATFQGIVKKHNSSEALHFDKYTFRPIDWHTDKYQKGVLFIGSPWSLPQKDLKKEDILEKIYLTNGNLAFLIVSLRP